MSAPKLKESLELRECKSTASRNSESGDTDTSLDAQAAKLGGRDPSYQKKKIDPNHWIVHGKKFDLTKFVDKHPGGAHSISFGKGRECTALVEQYHPFSDKVWDVLRKYEVKDEGEDESDSSDEAWPPKDPFYEELKQVMRNHFPEGYKTTKGTYRVFMLWLIGTITMSILFYQMIANGSILCALLAGIVYVMVHSRITHEGSHFGLTTNQTFNYMIANLYAYPTLCVSSWELQHVINHHQYTNYLPEEANEYQLVDVDAVSYDWLCDIANSLPVSQAVWKKLLIVLIPLVYATTPISVGAGNAYKVLTQGGIGVDNILKVKSHRKYPWDAAALLLIQISIIGYMAHIHGFARAITCWMTYLFGNGMLFVTFSQVSHIPCMTKQWRPTASKMKSWATGQVEHSMNFAQDSSLAFYLSFGLNFQIEHHLFPSISHDHYAALAPKFEAVCKKHGVTYWSEPSLTRSVGILYDALADLKSMTPVNFQSQSKKTQ